MSEIPKHGGDDLEDDFVFDDTVALSGDEESEPIAHLDDEDVFVEAGDDEGEDNGGGSDDDVDEAEASTSKIDDTTASKKRKRREKEKERKVHLSSYLLDWQLLLILSNRKGK